MSNRSSNIGSLGRCQRPWKPQDVGKLRSVETPLIRLYLTLYTFRSRQRNIYLQFREGCISMHFKFLKTI